MSFPIIQTPTVTLTWWYMYISSMGSHVTLGRFKFLSQTYLISNVCYIFRCSLEKLSKYIYVSCYFSIFYFWKWNRIFNRILSINWLKFRLDTNVKCSVCNLLLLMGSIKGENKFCCLNRWIEIHTQYCYSVFNWGSGSFESVVYSMITQELELKTR